MTPCGMPSIAEILLKMKVNPSGVTFAELRKVCEYFFGTPRHSGGSHMIFKTPWQGDPRINIQNSSGRAKAYQVRQVLAALSQLQKENDGQD